MRLRDKSKTVAPAKKYLLMFTAGIGVLASANVIADQLEGEFPPEGYGLTLESAEPAKNPLPDKITPQALPQKALEPTVPAAVVKQPAQQLSSAIRAPRPASRAQVTRQAASQAAPARQPAAPRTAAPYMPAPISRTFVPQQNFQRQWPYAPYQTARPMVNMPGVMPGMTSPWAAARPNAWQRPMGYPGYPQMPGAAMPYGAMPQLPYRQAAPAYSMPMPAAPNYYAPYRVNPYGANPYGASQNAAPSQNLARNMVMGNNPAIAGGRTIYPMQRKIKKEKHAWGDERNIWDDFYTDFTGDFWDSMINAPFDVGRMPGGWRAPSFSSPDPVTIGDAVTNQIPPMLEEMGNMTDFTD